MSRRSAVLLGLLLLAARSDAAVLCRAGSGKLALREKCHKAEQAVDPGQIDVSSLTGPAGVPGAPGARGRHPIAIVDSADVQVGTTLEIDYLGLGAFVAVTDPALTETLVFVVSSAGFAPNRGGAISAVFYTTTDCAGVPYVKPQFTALRFGQVYGNSLYYDTGQALSYATKSQEYDSASPCSGSATATARGTCCANSDFTTSVAPAVRVPLADLGFVPPFRAVPR